MQNPDIGAYVQRGRQAMAERRFDDARGIYKQILQLDPAQPRAWLALSAIAQSQGDFRESVRAVRSAVPAWKRSGSQQFITELSMRLLVLGEYEAARDLVVSADWSDPIVLRYSVGLVQYLGLVDAHDEALQLADHAISRLAQPTAALVYARANALRYLGRLEEASLDYERCVALDPLHAEGHWALANHKASQPPGVRLARVRKAIAHTDPQSEDAIYLQYALYKELENAGEFEAAWNTLNTGSQLKRKRVRYNAEAHEQSYLGLERLWNREYLENHQNAPRGGTHVPIFIVGLPRSGTTVLERILGNHPAVASAGELNDFPMELSWHTNSFPGEFPGQRTIEACRNLDFTQIGQGYLSRTAWRMEGQGRRFLIDKLPNNVANAGFISKALPEARIICVQRNPMDSCFSTFRHLFSGDAYGFSYELGEMAAHYKRFARLAHHLAAEIPERMTVVDYEGLIRDPETAVRSIAEFCGLEYLPGMLDIEGNSAPSATASSSQIREGLHARNIDGWRRYATQLSELGRSFGS